ncbi:phage tail spike protein [Bacillus pacificus]|uniref:phage tail spike protein n=1 Tax=Bacillus pacificus TaxID=2026187 RepID=UPI0027F34709|nr:phage tail spike protein [Bacillus pacificus]MDQ7236517.1 phage tail spike protein [Bacillus pacificus]MDQ7237743.1 phage tail spike protein [Bacillus pacificus]
MRTPSGELHVVDFKTEQIVASIQPIDYWDDKRHWEIKNNIDTLEFHVFDNTRHSSTLMQQNLVLKEVRDGRIVPYVITEIEKNSDDRSVIAYASGEWIQLAKAGIIPPQKLEGKTVIEMMDIALAGTKWKKGNLEYASFRSMIIDEFIDPLSFLKKIASLFELEIQYRAEVVGSQIVGRYVDMVKKRGRETGKEITLGKDLLGIKRIENSQNICTALLGFVKKEGGEFVTIAEINGGVPYLVDSDAFQRWNEKGQHKFGFYSPETENEDMDAKRLMVLMNTELKKRVNSSVFYEVEAQSIGRVFGLNHELINDGDTIRIKDTGFTPKLYLEARAIAGDESYKNPLQDKYVFGDYHEIIDPNEELRKIYNRILSSLGNKQEMIDQLDKLVKEANETASNAKKESEAAKTLAEKVQENIKNNTVEIIESKYPPTTGLKDRKTLWLDSSNGKPGILKLWKDGIWDPVVPDVESVKKETLEQVNKDIESTKTELNQKVQEAQNQTTGQFNHVQEGLQGVSRTISNIENKQGEIDKKVTQFEQDSNGFKTSIESLTKKDTEISSKLNTVEQTVEGTKQTISDVKQTTNDLTKTTNEIKQTADTNKQTISQLKTDVSNISVGSINLASGSETGLNKQNMTGTWSDSKQMTLSDKINYRNKTFTISFLFTGKMTKINTNPWFGVEAAITYADGEQEYKSIRTDVKLSLNVDYKDEPLSSTFKTKDKDVTQVRFYYSGRNIDGNLNSRHAKFEEGNIRTTWQLANEEVTFKADFTQKTTEIEKSVDGVKTIVTNVQNSQAGFEKRMSTVEQTASGLSSTVSNLNNVVSDQGKKLTEANTKLEQQATAINAKVELKQVEDYVAGFKIPELKQTVDQNKEVLLDELANKLATEQFNQKMTMIDNRFSVNEKGIDLAAKKTEVYTRIQADGQFAKDSYVRDLEGRIQVTETNILSTVKKGDIISSINQTAEKIKIQAGKIELDGTTIAKYLEAQELKGTTIRTDNSSNYVHIQKQFIRLMESALCRVYLGYYNDRAGQIQPTVVLGGDSSFQDGSVVLSKQSTQGFLGIINGKDSNGDPYFVSSVAFKRSGDLNLSAGMNGNVTINSGKGIGHYAKGGSFWAEATDGVTLKGGAKSVWMDCQSSIVFNLNGKNMLDIVATPNAETDLRFQTVTLRNGNVDGYKTLQVKDGTGNAFNAVTASSFQTASKREYKTNIRDVQFDAIEKIMALQIRQYNLKTDIEDLYEKRINRIESDPILTTNDIETHYGWIADDENTPGCFVTKEKNAAEIYSSLAIQIKAFQEEKNAKDTEIEELKEENKQMNRRIEVLEQLLVQNLINKKPEQP